MMAPANGTSTTNSGAAVVINLPNDTTNNSSNTSRNIKNETNSNRSSISSYYHNDNLSCNSDTQTTRKSNNNDDDNNNGNEKTNLIVNYLPQPMTDAEFTKLFGKYGNIKTAKVVRNKGTGYSYGYGFVDFQTNAEALSAIEGLDGHKLENKKIKVAFARPAGEDIKQANLYVKNIPNNWTEHDVRKLFESYGNIIQCRVLGNSRGVAFVLFDLRRQAEDALEALNGTMVSGGEQPLEIKFAADNAQKSGHGRSGNASNNSTTAYKNHHGSNDRHNNSSRALHNQQRNSTIATFVSPYEPSQQQLMQQNFYPANNYYSQQQPFDNYTIRHQQGLRVQSQYTVPCGGGLQTNQFADQYNAYSNTPIGSPGPIRQSPTIRQNRYAPFTPQQAHMPPVQQIQQQTSQSSYQYQDQRLIQPFNQAPTLQPSMIQQPVDTPTSVPISGLDVFGGSQSTSSIPQVVNSQFVVQSRTPMGPAFSNLSHQTGNAAVAGNINSNNAAPNQAVSSVDGVTLFVYNIGSDGDENLLQELFSSFGPVLKCNVVRKPPNQECKGYGFVTLPDQKQANAAIKRMNGYVHNGRALQVSFKK